MILRRFLIRFFKGYGFHKSGSAIQQLHRNYRWGLWWIRLFYLSVFIPIFDFTTSHSYHMSKAANQFEFFGMALWLNYLPAYESQLVLFYGTAIISIAAAIRPDVFIFRIFSFLGLAGVSGVLASHFWEPMGLELYVYTSFALLFLGESFRNKGSVSSQYRLASCIFSGLFMSAVSLSVAGLNNVGMFYDCSVSTPHMECSSYSNWAGNQAASLLLNDRSQWPWLSEFFIQHYYWSILFLIFSTYLFIFGPVFILRLKSHRTYGILLALVCFILLIGMGAGTNRYRIVYALLAFGLSPLADGGLTFLRGFSMWPGVPFAYRGLRKVLGVKI